MFKAYRSSVDMLAPSEAHAGLFASLTHLTLQGELPKAPYTQVGLLLGLNCFSVMA